MQNFWDSNVWGFILIFAVLFVFLLIGNILRKSIPFLKSSLIPTSVLGGAVLLAVSGIYEAASGASLFDAAIFGGNGSVVLETITYHALALGFIASSLKTTGGKLGKKRTGEIFNTGVTTVSTYLLQGIFGMGITIVAALFIDDFFAASGLILPFGYGQGTGQALNYGGIYEAQYGFANGKGFGLTIATMGFLSAALGGVIHLNIMKRKGRYRGKTASERKVSAEEIEAVGEIPMQESVDKLTVQVALIFVSYLIAYLLMFLLGKLLPGMKATVYGFNFLLGVISATLVKQVIRLFKKMGCIKKEYTNNFLLTRTSNFFFDIMIIAGVAAIRIDALKEYWAILLILGVVGLIITYVYNRIVARVLFKEYEEEQFLAMFGMLTGTASTGIILLREIDGDFKTPAADNLVYQNFPAIVFGFPLMLLASFAPKAPALTLAILAAFFIVMNIILFRSFIFKRKKRV